MESVSVPLGILLSGGFVFGYGLRQIVYFEFIYKSGRRLLAKEAQLKQEGIDFEQIRKVDP